MGRDTRDDRTWVVLELTRSGEALVQEGGLDQVLRDYLGADDKHPVFIPSINYTRHGKLTTVCLMEGYAFVASGMDEVAYFRLETQCPFVRQVLTQPGRVRSLKVVPQSSISEMQAQLAAQASSDIEEGMRVMVTEGLYSALEGEVLILSPDEAFILLEMRSLKTIQVIPRAFLAPAEESDGL